jgi:hypothetical protein
MGIHGVVLNRIKSFLADRKQFVELYSKTNNIKTRSKIRTTNIGVPQGTVLGPHLYIIYVNYLSKSLGQGTVAIYADDTSHLVTSNNMELLVREANRAVANMESFLEEVQLIINPIKTTFLNFHTAQRLPNQSPLIKLRGKSIIESTETKFLGVTITSTLNWSPHINVLSKKLLATLHLIRNLKNKIGKETLLLSYFGLFQSRIAY